MQVKLQMRGGARWVEEEACWGAAAAETQRPQRKLPEAAASVVEWVPAAEEGLEEAAISFHK
jgi:hypothetical protein